MARFDRLYRLVDLLRQGRHTTVPELARRLGVSDRTIARDIAFLREQDVPVEGVLGRGGGVRILVSGQRATPRLDLSDQEVAALWLAVWLTASQGDPAAAEVGHSALEKIEQALPADRRDHLRALARRVLVGDAAARELAASAAPPRPGILAAVANAFAAERALWISYVDGEGRPSEREIDPHALLVQVPLWYLLAVDRAKSAPRTFRLDRVQRAEVLPETRYAALDPRSLFPELAEIGVGER